MAPPLPTLIRYTKPREGSREAWVKKVAGWRKVPRKGFRKLLDAEGRPLRGDSLSLAASFRVIPGTAAMSSTPASLMPLTEPKRRISSRFLLGPMPGIVSIELVMVRLERSLRW